jgi:Tfp pilus assembly protein PilO
MKIGKSKGPWPKLRGGRRGVFTLLLIGIALILAYRFAYMPIEASEKQVREELAAKKRALSKYQEYVKSGKGIEEELNQTAQRLEAVHAKLLPGETPQIIAANLQEVLKKLSERNGIQIKSFRVGEPKEMAFYVRIPVTIEINPTKSAASLAYFLYDVENYEKLLLISDIDITAPNMRTPNEVQGNLTVTGFARNTNPSPKGKGKEG